MKWSDSARAHLRLLFASRAAESRMNDEFRFHIEMETDQLMRAKGLAADEARRHPRRCGARATRASSVAARGHESFDLLGGRSARATDGPKPYRVHTPSESVRRGNALPSG